MARHAQGIVISILYAVLLLQDRGKFLLERSHFDLESLYPLNDESLHRESADDESSDPILQSSTMILANSPFRGKQTVKVFFAVQ